MNKKLKKALPYLALVGALVSSTTGIISASEPIKKTVKVGFRQVINVPEKNADEIYEELKDVMGITHWSFNHDESRFERIVNYNDIEVQIGDQTEITDESGKATFLLDGKDLNNIEIKVKGKEFSEPLKQNISAKSIRNSSDSENNDIPIVFNLDVSKMIDMENQEEPENFVPIMRSNTTNDAGWYNGEPKKFAPIMRANTTNDAGWYNGELGVKGKLVHCNRFNGTLSDNKYWTNNDFSWNTVKASKNFIGSDCDLAMLKTRKCVVAELTNNPWCKAKPLSENAKCSKVIGHSTRFHSHKK